MTQRTKIYWHLVFLIAFGSLVLFVLCHVLFVAFYSMLMDVGHDEAFYNEFAQNTGAPFVFFFAPLPIFLMVRWMGIKVQRGIMLHAILYVLLSLLIDVSIVVLADQAVALTATGFLLAHLAKILAAFLGGWAAQKHIAKTITT